VLLLLLLYLPLLIVHILISIRPSTTKASKQPAATALPLMVWWLRRLLWRLRRRLRVGGYVLVKLRLLLQVYHLLLLVLLLQP
jgi:hypothetical protein